MPVDVQLDFDRGVPLYRQIADAVLSALSTGTLTQGEQLPTIHELARRLDVNPNTVARAYRDLEQGGHIVSRRGRGTFPALRTPDPIDAQSAMRDIYERAISDAARQKISAQDLLTYFQETLDESSR